MLTFVGFLRIGLTFDTLFFETTMYGTARILIIGK